MADEADVDGGDSPDEDLSRPDGATVTRLRADRAGTGRLRRWGATAIGVAAAILTGWLMFTFWSPASPDCRGQGLDRTAAAIVRCDRGTWRPLADASALRPLDDDPVDVRSATTTRDAPADTAPPPRTGVTAKNLVANPGLEDVAPPAGTPARWNAIQFGENVVDRTSPLSGPAHGGGRAARTEISTWASGGAAWSFTPVPIAAGQSFRYSEWYRSSLTTEVGAVFTFGTGPDATEQYAYLGAPQPTTEWTPFTAIATAPPGATRVSVYHSIEHQGWVEVDDVSLVAAQPLTRPIISLTFDDRDRAHAEIAAREMESRGLVGTFYVTSGPVTLGPSGRMTNAQVRLLVAAGHQIASHTVNHPDLVEDEPTPAELDTELRKSRAMLERLTGHPVEDFAAPFGSTNEAVRRQIMEVYRSNRSVEPGTNALFTTDFSALRSFQVDPTTTADGIRALIEQARAERSWLILTFHDLIDQIPPNDRFSITPTTFAAILDEVARSGLPVRTMADARTEVQAQLDAASG